MPKRRGLFGIINQHAQSGEVRERLNRAVSKTVEPLRVPWVRIPPSPPFIDTREIRLRPAGFVGQDGILRAGWQPAPSGHLQVSAGGLPTRRRLPTCPTSLHFSSQYFTSLYRINKSLRRAVRTLCPGSTAARTWPGRVGSLPPAQPVGQGELYPGSNRVAKGPNRCRDRGLSEPAT